MIQSRFTEEQMLAIPREADRSPVSEVAKKHALSEQSIYGWRKRTSIFTNIVHTLNYFYVIDLI